MGKQKNKVLERVILDKPLTVADDMSITRGGAPSEYRSDGQTIVFQSKPLGPGVTNEALLAVVIDRLKGFQCGEFANDFNQRALDACLSALEALDERTQDRAKRGVEGD